MRTHGHREGNITHWGLLGVGGLGEREQGVEGWGGIILGEIPNVGEGGMEATNHHGVCIPM